MTVLMNMGTASEKPLDSADKNLLMIFVKHPVPGKVKTRLAADIGDRRAAEIYTSLLIHTRETAAGLGVRKQVWYADEIRRDDLWPEALFEKKKQVKGDLGERMSAAFSDGFRAGCERIVIIGSDCSEITAGHIAEAFSKLNEYDVVAGPASDGGYYLLGMTRMIPELFAEKSWSTGKLYRQTLDALGSLELPVYELELLNDIDSAEDLPGSRLETDENTNSRKL